ncbi:uncharacterized protein F5147DRAFT_655441 [Suillus discolor]|uniref:Uncharacterized protein n=1 Tax=Suillus discolor TaxID=1912936 RepID=A0A9P7JQT7_9AGAM|nr:uncharacterized protein F5147DRAFT_655441 [Suillus discolor]KAG2101116.1 hypothetical protein F5147DRAFT_655441 [Suillus discolor]
MELREFSKLAGTIVVRCPKLIYLTGDHSTLRFTNTRVPHKYPFLTGLKVSGQDLQLLAPLLVQLFNLEFFEMHQSYGDGDALGHSFSPPTFKLSNISISQTDSQTIESLEVQEVGSGLCHLIEVIGDFVKKLHIKQLFDMIVRSDLGAIKALYGLPRLRSLRIDGQSFKTEPLLNLQSSLETFAFSNAVARNVQARLESGWQPSLRSLDMYCGPGLLTLLPWIPTMTEQKEVRLSDHQHVGLRNSLHINAFISGLAYISTSGERPLALMSVLIVFNTLYWTAVSTIDLYEAWGVTK